MRGGRRRTKRSADAWIQQEDGCKRYGQPGIGHDIQSQCKRRATASIIDIKALNAVLNPESADRPSGAGSKAAPNEKARRAGRAGSTGPVRSLRDERMVHSPAKAPGSALNRAVR